MKQRILLLIGSTILCLIFSEIVLHVVFRIRNGSWLWQNSPFDIHYAAPVSDRRQYNLRPNYTDKESAITINKLGFRGALVSADVDNLLVYLGDSIPFGYGVKDDETHPFIMSHLLKGMGYKLNVLNAGVPSYNMRQSFDRLIYDVEPNYKSANKIIIVQAANDVSLLTQYRENWTPDVTWADIRMSSKWNIPQYNKSAIIYHFRELLMRIDTFKQPEPNREEHRKFDDSKMISNIRHVIDEGLQYCLSNNMKVILLPIDPFYYQTMNTERNEVLRQWGRYKRRVKLWKDSSSKINNLLVEFAKTRKDVFFFDTRKILDQTDRNLMYIDFGHYSPEGNKLVAESLIDFMIANQLIGK